jgi:hypothetical protein
MASAKSKRKRSVFLHPKTRQFVAPNFKGAIEVAVRVSDSPPKPRRVFRDSKGHFTTPQKAARSAAAKKAAATRKLKRLGAERGDMYTTAPEFGSQPRLNYNLRRVNPEVVRGMVERELPTGKNASYYIRIRYLDSDGVEHWRQTGWFRGESKSNPDLASEAAESLISDYGMEEILDIEVVFGFYKSVVKHG